MIFSTTRKRSRDIEEDLDLGGAPFGKRSRASTDHAHSFTSSASRPWLIPRAPLRASDPIAMPDVDCDSTASDADMSTDDSMDMDIGPGRAPQSPQLTPLSSSWSGPSTWAMLDRPPRRADSLLSRPVRPKPYPLQPADVRAARGTIYSNDDDSSTTMMMMTTPVLGAARQPSPLDADEPHTPITVAGSQFSLLSVSDMDIDSTAAPTSSSSAPSTPMLSGATPVRHAIAAAVPDASATGSFIRKQGRQRSGAFISSPSDAAKRFQLGYREDCDKCRDRVPGHMNHFIGT